MSVPAPVAPNLQHRARRIALLSSGLYLGATTIYILVTDSLLSASGLPPAQLAWLGIAKGLGFMVLTAAALGVLLYVVLTRQARAASELLRSEVALVEAERRALAGMLTSSIAHDLRNLLMVVDYSASELVDAPELSPESRAVTRDLHEASQQAIALVRRLREASRGSLAEEPRLLDLGSLVEAVIEVARRHPVIRGIRLELDIQGEVRLTGHQRVLEQAILNLVLNAAEATGGAGRVRIAISGIGLLVLVEVHDDGPGVPPALVERIFEPLFTTRAEGSGLGLLSVKVCAALHQGQVLVQASPLGGACFRLELRRDGAPQGDDTLTGWSAPPSGGAERPRAF